MNRLAFLAAVVCVWGWTLIGTGRADFIAGLINVDFNHNGGVGNLQRGLVSSRTLPMYWSSAVLPSPTDTCMRPSWARSAGFRSPGLAGNSLRLPSLIPVRSASLRRACRARVDRESRHDVA